MHENMTQENMTQKNATNENMNQENMPQGNTIKKNTIIVYKSKTGFTKRYAEQLAGKLGCTALAEKEAKPKRLRGCHTLVFGTRAHAGRIDGLAGGLRLCRQSGAQRLVLFVTGAMPCAAREQIEALWKQNLSEQQRRDIPHFYLQSGLCYERMGWTDRMMMRGLAAMLRGKKNKTPEDAALQQAIAASFAASFDHSDPAFLQPMLELLRK